MRLVFIGGGNMGGSILLALIKANIVPAEDILLVEPDEEKRLNLSQFTGCESQATIDEKVSDYDFLILAVKPQGSEAVLEELKPFFKAEQVLISVMAGISIKTMSDKIGVPKIVRVMPNIPTLIEEGMSVFFASSEVEDEERVWVNKLFTACGTCLEANTEDAIDASTAISGSGPGYVFYFAEKMLAAAKALGFSEQDAAIITKQTIKGAVLLWESQNVAPEQLRLSVSSPGGTTLAALTFFEENGVGNKIQEGMYKAYERAKELSK